jgi:hypothetical protein
MDEITHDEFMALTPSHHVHIGVMEIGNFVRDGADYVLDDTGKFYREDVRLGYVLERISETDFKLHRPLITGIPNVMKESDHE